MTTTSKYLEKLKLQKPPCFVDSITVDIKELEKVFLPTRFLANASKHISILLWNHLIFNGQSKIEKSLLPTAQKKHRAPLTVSFQMENSVLLDTEKKNRCYFRINSQFINLDYETIESVESRTHFNKRGGTEKPNE